MSLKRNLALLVALGVAAAGVGSSGATFTSSSAATGEVSAARDWVPPTVALTNPGTPLSGTVALAATASDAVSGVASVAIQVAPNGSSSFTTICTDTTAPYTCSWSTAGVATGKYDLRAVATDVDGNSATSALIDSRWVDNTTPSVVATAPAGPLRGSVTVGATSTTASGMGSVVLERAPTGTATWTTICTSASTTASCTWDTTAVADGTYDVRASLTTASGRTATSAVLTGRRIDNTAPTGVDVQAANKAGGTAGRLESGDTLVLTYSEAMQASSLVSGWSGTGGTPITVSVSTGTPVMTFGTATGGGTPALGAVTLSGTYVSALSTGPATFAGTATLNAAGTVVTVTLGAQSGGTLPLLGVTAAAGTMRWTPSASALDLAGNPSATTQVTESGASDVDF